MKKSEKTKLTISKILEAAMVEFGKMDIPEKVKMHEMIVSKLLDYMLYGIAEGEKENDN